MTAASTIIQETTIQALDSSYCDRSESWGVTQMYVIHILRMRMRIATTMGDAYIDDGGEYNDDDFMKTKLTCYDDNDNDNDYD